MTALPKHLAPPDTVGRQFANHELIVSKTDLRGRITYANNVFLRIADYTEAEVLGKPHNIIRHPAMPRVVFHYLWEELKLGNEVFAYVVNKTKGGEHYWVMAHVTPTFGPNREIVGFQSSRRAPTQAAISKVAPLYTKFKEVEEAANDRQIGLKQSTNLFETIIEDNGGSYEQFILGL